MPSSHTATTGLTHAFAHDLRSNLRAITMQVQLLQRQPDSTEASERLAEILRVAKRQEELIQSVVELEEARLQGVDQHARAPLGTVVQSACLKLDAFRKEQSGTVRFDVSTVPPADVPTGIGRAIEKVLHNALKFHRAGEAPVAVLEAGTEAGQAWVRVSDEGVGIPPEYAETVMQPFRRLHAASEYPGNGLGLSIAACLAESAGGRLTVENAPTGAAIRITCLLCA